MLITVLGVLVCWCRFGVLFGGVSGLGIPGVPPPVSVGRRYRVVVGR